MSHTPAPGTNPFGPGYVIYNNPVPESSNEPEGVIIDLEQLPEFRALKQAVVSLNAAVESHRQCIQQMAEEIDRLKRNNSGQRVNQTTGYWEERCY